MSDASVISGGCLCGAVRYEGGGKPFDVTHCHCEDCRRSSGAAFVTWTSFRREEFHYTRGKPRVLEWAGRLRAFCGECGTPLTFMTDAEAEEVGVTVSSFDEPDRVTPRDHTWVEDRLAWVKMGDGLPEFRRDRGGE